VVCVLAFPWLPFVSFSVLGSANLAAYYAMVAVSLVVVTGWVGQISLGHAGLVGVGAYVTGHVVGKLHIGFPANMLWAMAAGAGVAAMLGAVAVRVRGLYLAVATLIFSWTASEFLFRQRWFTGAGVATIKPFGKAGTFPYFDWTTRRTFFYAAWAAVAAAILLATNLRESKTGRAFFAVRGSEVAAASLGISVVRTKLVAFAVSGAMAAAAGNLLMVRDQVVTADAFRVEVSLFFLAVAVVGGLSSLGGAVAASLLFAGLNELFFRVEQLAGWLEVVPPILLTVVLLAYRGGLAALPESFFRRWGPQLSKAAGAVESRWSPVAASAHGLVRRAAERLWEALPSRPQEADEKERAVRTRLRLDSVLGDDGDDGVAADAQVTAGDEVALVAVSNGGPPPARTWRHLGALPVPLAPDRPDRTPLVEVDGVTVRFGGLVAANDISLTVREHEIVGLIGPNGAGKTTTFNAIAGLNVPASGRVSIYGEDVTEWTVDERARLGVGRTFQAIQLVPQLTVFENLMVATHVHNESGFLSHLFLGPMTTAAERVATKRVRRVAELLELDSYLDRRVADLPFGILRMIELARALVTEARLIMLDEPASGLDNNETERLTEILRFLRGLGVTLLLIEHDVRMVTSVSDYMYVLDQGRLLAEGTPAAMQRDPRVIAAYLGQTEDRQPEVASA
jgi:ABC-type branched-subunit amino acid transport system ATPase component/ABC-type branched-subunit amino acid transport system permease subunit